MYKAKIITVVLVALSIQFFFISPNPVRAQTTLAEITVEAGLVDRIDTPVSVSLEGIPVSLDSPLSLQEIKGNETAPVTCQVEPGSAPRLWWIHSGNTPAGTIRSFKLIQKSSTADSTVDVTKNDSHLDIAIDGQNILRYNHAPFPPPQGKDPLYTRSGFIHPIWSPAGEVLSQIHPKDHTHHMGLWHPWTKTKFEGREVDFWNLAAGQGTVRFAKFANLVSGPVFGGFKALQEHVDLKAPGGEKIVLNEQWELRVWNVGRGQNKYRLWELTATQNCAGTSPLELFKYHYGGFGFRARQSWHDGDYLSSEGKTKKDGHNTPAKWCMMFGPTDTGPAGILMMSHPHNHAHPETVRFWADSPVFFGWCAPASGDWTLLPGKDYTFRYRLLTYDGKITPAQAERFWQDFSNPPQTLLKKM